MKILRISAVVLAAVVPAMAHAQMNPIFSALQSAISKTNQLRAQEDSASQSAAAQAQGQAQMEQQMGAQRESDQQYGTGSAGYGSDQAAIQASNQRAAEQQQRDAAEARATPSPCPNVNLKLTAGAFLVACKNAGATEQQLLARLGALPVTVQALYADIIQDIFDNHVSDPAKGDAIARYDATCTSQNNCQRRAW